MQFGETSATAINAWPSRENPTWYKFNSLFLELLQEHTTYERSTYSALEWLGDVGGLFDGLGLIAHLVVGQFSAFALKAELLTKIFKL